MEIRQARLVDVVVDVQCDRCGRSCLTRVPPDWEGLEYGALAAQWGYGSKNHGGERYELHLCEGCFFGFIAEIEHERFISTMYDAEPYQRGSIERHARVFAGEDPKPVADASTVAGASMESTEAERYARVGLLAGAAFRDSAKARRWLLQPHQRLGGRSPFALAGTEEGVKAVEELLSAPPVNLNGPNPSTGRESSS